MKKLLIVMFSFFIITTARADVNIIPPDLTQILHKIAEHQRRLYQAPQESAVIQIKDDQIIFADPSGKANADMAFSGKSKTIAKHITLRDGDDPYAFSVLLQKTGADYNHVVQKINGADALVFFKDEEVFVYTQAQGEDGRLHLKEWIYARKPNAPDGSFWEWIFVADQLQWPITLDMDQNGQAMVYRNMPIAGFPIDVRARYNYMMQMMLKSTDNIKKFFPFKEELATIPPTEFWTREGIKLPADVAVSNTSDYDVSQLEPHRMNFKKWDKLWQSVLKVSVKAKPSDYPLLIDPKI